MTAANRKAAVRCIQSLRHSRVAAVVYFFSVFFTLACDQNRYELKDDRSGRTIRLDKRTGEIVVIAGDRLTRLKSVEEQDKIGRASCRERV